MSLVVGYSQVPTKRAVNVLIVPHFDSHGVAFAAARARVLASRGLSVEIASKFPETGPQGLSSGQLLQYVSNLNIAAQRIEVIDIPIDVKNPDASVLTLQQLSQLAPVYYYDHHETDLPFTARLLQAGITPVIAETNAALAASLELLADNATKELAVVGMMADRDSSVLRLVSREEVEQKYLPLANRLDIIVRSPQLLNVQTPGDVAKRLSTEGVQMLQSISVDYPPERLAASLQSNIVSDGMIAILVDWSSQQPQDSQWAPKALEQLLLLRRKAIAVAICPAFDPRTRQVVGYDVRVLRYWLSPADVPTPESIAKDLIAAKAISGQVVGHADYISMRYSTLDEARRVAQTIYQRIEGRLSTIITLINDSIVARAVQRDFAVILQKLEEILQQQVKMYGEYLELKKKQVELLEKSTDRVRYD